jgi:alpha-L-rhamnosidase
VGFRAALHGPEQQDGVLRIAASSLYRVYLNGQFIGHGPARGPHGYYRVDEWPLDLRGAKNVLAIEVAGYNVNSYYLLNEPAFLQAEVISEGLILASTAGAGAQFKARILTHRLQKVQRYSFQRPFIEYYRFDDGDDHWWDAPSVESTQVACATGEQKELLIRRVGYPRFQKRQALQVVSQGRLQRDVAVARLWKDRALVNIGPALKGYTEKELEVVPSLEMQAIRSASVQAVGKPYQPDKAIDLVENTFSIVDLGTNLTGFIGASVRCTESTKLYFTFD